MKKLYLYFVLLILCFSAYAQTEHKLSGLNTTTGQYIDNVFKVTEHTSNPTVNDDVDLGYKALNIWVNTSVDTAYICVDNANGAAIWSVISNGAPSIVRDSLQIGVTDSMLINDSSFVVTTRGRIGVGTISPLNDAVGYSGNLTYAPFALLKTATQRYGWSHTDGTVEILTYVDSTTGASQGGHFGVVTNHNLSLFTNDLARAIIDNSGNMSIAGAVVPIANTRFYVRGAGSTSATHAAQFLNSSSNDNFLFRDDGRFVMDNPSAAQLVIGASSSHFGNTNNEIVTEGDGVAFLKSTSITTSLRTPLTIIHKTSNDAAATFGASLAWAFADNGTTYQDLGDVNFSRGSADNVSEMQIRVYNAGFVPVLSATDTTITPEVDLTTSDGVFINTINGIDLIPGSDVDHDWFTSTVTGIPRFYWDESESAFALTATDAGGNLILDSPNGVDSEIRFFENGAEKAAFHYEASGASNIRLEMGGNIMSATYSDGEHKIYDQGETDPTVTAGTFSIWPEDANGAGTVAFNYKTEDGVSGVLNQDVSDTSSPTFIDLTADSINTDTITVTSLTASQIVETDAGKNLVSVAKKTGYNKEIQVDYDEAVVAAGGTAITFGTALSTTNYALTVRCFDGVGNPVAVTITNKAVGGFTATPAIDASLDYIAIVQ
jgi:hypothetical protein